MTEHDYKLAPVKPTGEQMDSARHIVQWLQSSARPTEKALSEMCRHKGINAPAECRDVDHVPPARMIAFWIYQAMLADAPAVKQEPVVCPCTTFEQDESCPVGYPSLVCSACGGKGYADIETVTSLAAEMLKLADAAGEVEDPFAAWETIDLWKSAYEKAPDLAAENARLREALKPFVSWFLQRRDAYSARHYEHRDVGYGNFDKMPDSWPMEKIEFDMGTFRKAVRALNGGDHG